MSQANTSHDRSLFPKRVLYFVFAGVVLLRLWNLFLFVDTNFFLPKQGDMAFYEQWAKRILGGEFSDGKAFYGLPGYPFLIAGLYKIFGINPFIISFFQVLLEAGTSSLIFCFVWRIANRLNFSKHITLTASLLGAVAYALAQPAQAFSLILMPTAWMIFALWAMVYYVDAGNDKLGWKQYLGLGVLCGAVATIVATVFALVPLLLIRAVLHHSTGKIWKRLGLWVIFVSGIFAGTSPCWIHNYFYAKEKVFLSAHGGLNLYVGNHAKANGYTHLPPELRATQEDMLSDSIRVPQEMVGHELSRAEVSAFWSQKAKTWIRGNKKAWGRLLLRKAQNFWNTFEYDDLTSLTVMREWKIIFPGPSFGWIAFPGLAGLFWFLLRRNTTEQWVAYAVCCYFLMLLPVFVTERYRLPVLPGLIVLAVAFALHVLKCVQLHEKRSLFGACGLLAVSGLIVFYPVTDQSILQHNAFNTALIFIDEERYQEAENRLKQVLRDGGDNNAEVYFSLGNIYLKTDRAYDAKMAFRKTLQLDPLHARAWNNLGVMAFQEGYYDTAFPMLSRAVQLTPKDAKGYYLLALTLQKLNRTEAALKAINKAIELSPEQKEFQQLKAALSVP